MVTKSDRISNLEVPKSSNVEPKFLWLSMFNDPVKGQISTNRNMCRCIETRFDRWIHGGHHAPFLDQLLSMIDYGELSAKNNCQTSAFARQKAKRGRFFLFIFVCTFYSCVAFLAKSSTCFYCVVFSRTSAYGAVQ